MGASSGMKTVAATPASRAASANACPSFPALAVTTPAARSSSDIVASLLTAPRILNEPVRWRFSALRKTLRPLRLPSVSEEMTGVSRARPCTRSRAAWISASVGPAAVFMNLEHLLHDLAYRRQGVELPPLNRLEQPL